MNKNFNYKDVPRSYLHCLNAQCGRSGDCLRFLAGLHVSKEVLSFSIINPACVSDVEVCLYFQSNGLTRFALGISRLYDCLPHRDAVRIRDILFKALKRNTYYRIANRERLIRPEEQDLIRAVFEKEGNGAEVVFDEYVDRYMWC